MREQVAYSSTPARSPTFTESFEIGVNTPAGPALIKLSRVGRNFTVTDFAVNNRPELVLAFGWGRGVENLDETSDAAQALSRSCKVRYGDVIVGNDVMRANSIEELQYALKQIPIRPFNPEEI